MGAGAAIWKCCDPGLATSVDHDNGTSARREHRQASKVKDDQATSRRQPDEDRAIAWLEEENGVV